MGRDIPYDFENTCDLCGKGGAYDFMGDYICQDCLDECDDHEEEPE